MARGERQRRSGGISSSVWPTESSFIPRALDEALLSFLQAPCPPGMEAALSSVTLEREKADDSLLLAAAAGNGIVGARAQELLEAFAPPVGTAQQRAFAATVLAYRAADSRSTLLDQFPTMLSDSDQIVFLLRGNRPVALFAFSTNQDEVQANCLSDCRFSDCFCAKRLGSKPALYGQLIETRDSHRGSAERLVKDTLAARFPGCQLVLDPLDGAATRAYARWGARSITETTDWAQGRMAL